MGASDVFTVVREIYPETKGLFFKSRKCPGIDDARELAYGMSKSGAVARLDGAKERSEAVKRGDRIFAVGKRYVPYSSAVLRVCKEDGYEWNYAIEGVIRISDPQKFLSAWAKDEGSCGLDGIDSDRFAHRVIAALEPTLRDEINSCRKTHGYRISDIQEKDILPVSFWTKAFASISEPVLDGLTVEVADKAFLSPNREMEEQLEAAAAAQRELENKAKSEYQAAVDGMMAENELAELERQRVRAELDFRLEVARKEAEIRKCQAEALQFEIGNLIKDKNDIASAIKGQKGGSGQMEALKAAMAEVSQKLESMVGKLSTLGVTAETAPGPSARIDPVVAPRHEGMSDNFISVMESLRSGAEGTISVSMEAARHSDGYASRDLMPARRKEGGSTADGVVHIGDRLTLRLKSPRSGYLTLFNFGTSGGVSKIFPHPAFGTVRNLIEAGKVYMLPGELMPASALPDGEWEELGPTTSSTGFPERVVAVLTDENVELDEQCFGQQVGNVLTRGGFDAVEESISSILDLPSGSWIWGAVEAAVED